MSNAADLYEKPFIREATYWDVVKLALTMRREDVDEIWHSSRKNPTQALLDGFECGETWAIERQGRTVAMFGISGKPGSHGCPWMLGSPEISRCKSLLRECILTLDGFLENYKSLSNSVWSKNLVHINWIKWLGFNFKGESTRNGETFLYFHKEYQNV